MAARFAGAMCVSPPFLILSAVVSGRLCAVCVSAHTLSVSLGHRGPRFAEEEAEEVFVVADARVCDSRAAVSKRLGRMTGED